MVRLIAILLLPLALAHASANCDTYTFCEDCASHGSWISECRWCPKDGGCHAYGSVYNTCSSSEQITDPDHCPATPAPPPPVSQDCDTFTDCTSCAAAFSWAGFNTHCRWCPKDGGCHAFGSLKNTCSSSEQIDDVNRCGPSPPPPTPAPLDPHWCSGLSGVELPSDAAVDVIYAQAPLFSTNPSIGGALGKLGLHHTALVFQQDGIFWTLEFDVTAQNKFGHKMGDGFLPTIDGLDLTWDNEARWCLTEGLLHGRDHWTTHYASFAQISPTQFQSLVQDYVPSVNGTSGAGLGYNLFRVTDKSSGADLVPDVTCSNGAIWVRDHLSAKGVAISSGFDFKVTRLNIPVSSISEVTVVDKILWQEIVDFYKQFRNLADNGNLDIYGKISALTALFPPQFVYDSNLQKYFKLNNADNASPKFETAPSLWPFPAQGIYELLA